MITATAIVQIIGKPKDHLEKVITEVSEKIGELGYRSERVEIMPVEPLEGNEGLYSGLFEVDLLLKNHEQLFGFIQDFNPTSIEVSDPEEFEMSLADYNGLVTTVASTVQQYDTLLKDRIAEIAVLKQRVDLLTKNLVMISIATGPKRIGVISTETGLAEASLKPYLDALVQNRMIAINGEVYSVNAP
jgi:DNA-binding Lrp family transcriptional regulator